MPVRSSKALASARIPLGLLGDLEHSDGHLWASRRRFSGSLMVKPLYGAVVLHDGVGLLLHEAQVHLHRPESVPSRWCRRWSRALR
jgi:hypothetical protein